MKVPFVQKSYTFHRFNECTNTIEFDYDITVKRAMTLAEAVRYCQFRCLYIFWYTVMVLGVLIGASLILCAFASILPDWCAGAGIIGGSVIAVLAFWFVLQFGDDYKHLLNTELPKVGFEEEDAAHKSVEEYTQSCADAWRAAHPLEEKIRLAQKTKNCVDIAELVRYYGADLADKLK